MARAASFATRLVRWQRRHGRHGLPWQVRDPYRVWLSEVMLQQTQVATVIPYYERFLARFPRVGALARASEAEVLRLWSGLGYYARGRNLLAAARRLAALGRFPDTAEAIAELPGVGRSTAAAIAVFAFGRRAAILDGNVARVLARHFGEPRRAALWALAERLLPARALREYSQGLMDLGATVCLPRRPRCASCPVASSCAALAEGRIEELPARRARRPQPTKAATWLVLVHEGKVLLERRPRAGLWGGLLAFPETEPPGYVLGPPRPLPAVEHAFTHFRLRAQPVLHGVTRASGVESPQRLWLEPSRAAEAHVPTPVRRLLESLARDQGREAPQALAAVGELE